MKAFDRAALTQQLADGARALSLPLDERQQARLIDYLALLAKWNGVYNLTAIRDPQQMVTQHLLDSLAAVPAFAGARSVLDVGAGAGLPGMVLAIWAEGASPQMQISLIDTVQKKTAFLTQARAELGLANVSVHNGRVEELRTDRPFDVITSRAFAELSDFVAWSGHLLADDGEFVAMKGTNPLAEIERLPPGWEAGRVERLQVPGLQAERHLVHIRRSAR